MELQGRVDNLAVKSGRDSLQGSGKWHQEEQRKYSLLTLRLIGKWTLKTTSFLLLPLVGDYLNFKIRIKTDVLSGRFLIDVIPGTLMPHLLYHSNDGV